MFAQRMRLTFAACAGLFALTLSGPSHAAFQQLGNTNWEYETSPNVTILFNGGAGSTSANPYLVTISDIQTPNDNPIVTHWRQINDPVEGGDNYFHFDSYRANVCEWLSYIWTITDDNLTPADGEFHPQKAHFHAGALTQYAPFTTKTPTNNTGVYSMTVSNGPLPANSIWYASIIRVHDYDNYTVPGNTVSVKGGTPGKTAFTVTETPEPHCVPLPGTAVIFGVGCIVVRIAGSRRANWIKSLF